MCNRNGYIHCYTDNNHTRVARDVLVYDDFGRYSALQVIKILIAENYYSFNCRYPNNKEDISTLEYSPTHVAYTLPEVASAILTLQYQSCESHDYNQSLASQLLHALSFEVLRALQHEPNATLHSHYNP